MPKLLKDKQYHKGMKFFQKIFAISFCQTYSIFNFTITGCSKRHVCSIQKCNYGWVANIDELLKSCVQRIKVDLIKNLNSWLSAQVRAKILMNQLKWWAGAAWLTRHTGFIKWLMKRSSTLYRGPPKLEYLPTKNVKRTVKRITL